MAKVGKEKLDVLIN
jgi:secreted Zn-dependent insulinase-like peptidase